MTVVTEAEFDAFIARRQRGAIIVNKGKVIYMHGVEHVAIANPASDLFLIRK